MSLVVITDTKEGSSYCFDATFKETHTFENQITTNPVQEGTPINDHVYQQPIVFTWDVGMSDCLTSIYPGQFNSSEQRSVAAFDVLESLWENAKLLTVTTSFRQHKNMVIKQFMPYRDKSTMFGMRANVVFQQVIVTAATDIAVKESGDAQVTDENNPGNKSSKPSETHKTLTISEIYLGRASAKYQGKSIPLTTYFQTYSSDQGTFKYITMEVPDYIVTPIINASITNNTEFVVDGKTLSYAQLMSKYGK